MTLPRHGDFAPLLFASVVILGLWKFGELVYGAVRHLRWEWIP